MYLTRRMQSGGYAVYRQGLAEVLQLYNNKVERKTSLSPFPTINRFGREYNNQMTPQGLKLSSNPLVNAGNHFSNGSNNSKMQPSPPNRWFNFPSWGRWVIDSAISLVLSFWNNERMQKLKRIEGSEYISIISLILSLVLEYISEAAAHEAHLTQDFLHKDAISVSRNIIKNPKLVPGGRATKLTATLKQKSATIEGIEKWPYEATAIAFEAIPRTLAQNCGVNVIRTMKALQGKHENASTGIDGNTGAIADMKESKIWDAYNVKAQTFKTAIEAACISCLTPL